MSSAPASTDYRAASARDRRDLPGGESPAVAESGAEQRLPLRDHPREA